MTNFRYLVLNNGGKQYETVIEAADETAAKRLLRRQGLTLVKNLGTAARSEASGKWYKFEKKFNAYAFTNRLAPLLAAHIPLEKALAVIEEGASNPQELEVVRRLRQGLHEGKRFSQLTREMDRHFPPLYSSLLETGEESGCLPEVTGELRRFLKESKEFRDFVITSAIYPVIVVSVTFLVIILLFTVFIPKFAKIFAELGREMPFLTRTMLAVGNGMQAIWWFWPLLIAAIIYLIRLSGRNEKLRNWKDRLLIRTPVLNGIVEAVQVGRFIRTLSIMVKNHVHLLPAVKISRRVITNLVITRSFAAVEDNLRAGDKLSAILGHSPYMPTGSIAMLRIAEESGDLGEMLERIALEVEDDTRVKVKRLLALLEPAVILGLALIVLAVVLSIFLAIMDMSVIK